MLCSVRSVARMINQTEDIGFDPLEYIQWNPDLAELSPAAATQHYFEHGRIEQRVISQQDYEARKLPEAQNPPITIPFGRYSARIAVFVHIYYFEQWPFLRGYLSNLKDHSFDLYVNFADSIWTPEMTLRVKQDFPAARILISPNHGRDLAGVVNLSRHADLEQYDAVFLLHTKRSPHVSASISATWREHLLTAILGSPEKVNFNLGVFHENPYIGIIGTAYWCHQIVGAENQANYDFLMDRFQISEAHRSCLYVSGTMMMIRPQILQKLAEGLDGVELESGSPQTVSLHIDGQMAHAVERLIGNLCREMGYRIYWQI